MLKKKHIYIYIYTYLFGFYELILHLLAQCHAFQATALFNFA